MRNALTGVERALFWTLAFAAFAAAAAGLVARALDHVAVGYENARQGYAVVRVLAPEGPLGIAAAVAALESAPHVTSAEPMTAGRAAELLAQWGGSPVHAADIPALRLIEIDLAPAPAHADISGDIVASLAQGGVTAQVIEAPENGSGAGWAARVRTVSLWGAAGFAVLMTVIISLGARGIAARRRELVTVMTDLGATRGQAAGRIADEAAILGLYAGLIGGALAAILAIALLFVAIPGLNVESLRRMILPADLAPILAAPFVAAIAAGAGARAAAGYFHGQAARLG